MPSICPNFSQRVSVTPEPGFCYNVGCVVAATAPFTMSQITNRLGGDIDGFRRAGIRVGLVLLVGIVVLPFLPETKDRPLPAE